MYTCILIWGVLLCSCQNTNIFAIIRQRLVQPLSYYRENISILAGTQENTPNK